MILTKDALCVAHQRPRRKKRATKGPDEEVIAEIIQTYDRDGSGGLNREEVRGFLAEASGRSPTDDELLWVFQVSEQHCESSILNGSM